ncbi:MAG: SAM-dependent methyltransferase [Lachnospiraceae bacterium]
MINKATYRTEDQVRDSAKIILGFDVVEAKIQQGTGQITTFNQLGFKGINNKPDGWYLPDDHNMPAIILETKSESEDISLQKWVDELIKNCDIAATKYKQVVGILYNGIDTRVFKNNIEDTEVSATLQNKTYYTALFTKKTIDKQRIYNLTKKINDCLHTEFGIKNLYHRMIFTACALVAKRYEAILIKGMDFSLMKNSILSTLGKSLEESKKQNLKLDLLIDVYAEVKMNNASNQEAIDNFIKWVSEISDCVNSDYWNGEDVMGIFFNEFNRYKKKSESGQVFTPDHITSFMYRLIDIDQNDRVLDAACGSGAFLVKSMCNMIKEAGGINAKKTSEIKETQLFGIEFDREIFALACANMLIHKDGKTNLEQLDTRTQEACNWIKSKSYKTNKKGEFQEDKNGNLILTNNYITKVLMNPPFERKYGCLTIVNNVLLNVPPHTKCAFILPDKKLEKDNGAKLLKHSTLEKIIKLPEKTFSEGVTASIFIFESGVPQNKKEIFTCYIKDDGLETVKNQGRQDIKDRWQSIEERWVEIIRKQSGDDTIKWIKPSEHLSYQIPEKEFEISEEDFTKTMMDYLMFKQGIDVKEFSDTLIKKVMYSSEITTNDKKVLISLEGKEEINCGQN